MMMSGAHDPRLPRHRLYVRFDPLEGAEMTIILVFLAFVGGVYVGHRYHTTIQGWLDMSDE